MTSTIDRKPLANQKPLADRKPLAVIKVGGDMLIKQADRNALAANIQALYQAGWRCVLVHGGGPQLSDLQTAIGLTPNKIAGRRITNDADLKVVKQALCGEVNVDLVSCLVAEGLPAIGLHGASASLIKAHKRPPINVTGEFDEPIDFGHVGNIDAINTDLLEHLLSVGLIPVIATLGVGGDGSVYNINADTSVSAVAAAMHADLLILSTAVGGVFEDIAKPDSLIRTMNKRQADRLIADGLIRDGMIVKVESAFNLMNQGVESIVITNATQQNSFLNLSEWLINHSSQEHSLIATVLVND